jgi:hypothetical protein
MSGGWTIWALGAWLLALGGCAAANTGSPPRSMPMARAMLAPEHRIFHDALADYGDWVLIEPYGYLFRPRTDFHDWRPYQYGFWAPTDAYGWVWISSEPFGWATFHYGRWFHDPYHRWVWQPGSLWAPAWVSWQMNDRYVAWAPLPPAGRPLKDVPGGPYLFASLHGMGSPDLGSQVATQAQLGAAVADLEAADRTELVEGARVPVGPPIARIERATGRSLPRVRVDDLLSGGERADAPEAPAAGRAGPVPSLDETRRAAEQAAREARQVSAAGGRLPARLSIVRPLVEARRRAAPAIPDTARRR